MTTDRLFEIGKRALAILALRLLTYLLPKLVIDPGPACSVRRSGPGETEKNAREGIGGQAPPSTFA
jgi:hypothetical protein